MILYMLILVSDMQAGEETSTDTPPWLIASGTCQEGRIDIRGVSYEEIENCRNQSIEYPEGCACEAVLTTLDLLVRNTNNCVNPADRAVVRIENRFVPFGFEESRAGTCVRSEKRIYLEKAELLLDFYRITDRSSSDEKLEWRNGTKSKILNIELVASRAGYIWKTAETVNFTHGTFVRDDHGRNQTFPYLKQIQTNKFSYLNEDLSLREAADYIQQWRTDTYEYCPGKEWPVSLERPPVRYFHKQTMSEGAYPHIASTEENLLWVTSDRTRPSDDMVTFTLNSPMPAGGNGNGEDDSCEGLQSVE